MPSSIQEIYVTGLKNAHALESQAVELLKRQSERLENYPEIESRIRSHIEESRTQAERIEQILDRHDSSASTLKDMGTAFMGNMAAMGHAVMQDEVVKNTLANFAFEHFEIAAYRSLIALGEAAGDRDGVSLLRQSLAEEESMASFMGDHIEDTTMRYAQREAAGVTAGV